MLITWNALEEDEMANLTLAMDNALILSARRIALERDISLAEMIRGYLTELVEGWQRGRSAKARRLMATFERNSVNVGKRTWTREDLHAR